MVAGSDSGQGEDEIESFSNHLGMTTLKRNLASNSNDPADNAPTSAQLDAFYELIWA